MYNTMQMLENSYGDLDSCNEARIEHHREACTSVCKCVLPKSHPDCGKVDKSFCPCVVVVGGETQLDER